MFHRKLPFLLALAVMSASARADTTRAPAPTAAETRSASPRRDRFSYIGPGRFNRSKYDPSGLFSRPLQPLAARPQHPDPRALALRIEDLKVSARAKTAVAAARRAGLVAGGRRQRFYDRQAARAAQKLALAENRLARSLGERQMS